MSPFVPASEDSRPSKSRATKAGSYDGKNPEPKFRRAAIAFRIFGLNFPPNVESREGCPCRIRFRGMCGNVVTASGPWRTSGDWWENAWMAAG